MTKEFAELIERFAIGTVQDKYDVLRRLILERQHHKAAKDKDFQLGIDELAKTICDTSVPGLDRLLAVATLCRLSSTVKRLRLEIVDLLRPAMAEPLPDPSLLGEPDDRSYVANALEQVTPYWGWDYCARAAVYEETGEQARVAFLKALLMMSPDLSTALEKLTEYAQEYLPETEDPGTSVAKRLKRIMSVLQSAMADYSGEAGDDPGKQLALFCRAMFMNADTPKQAGAVFEAAEGIAATIHELIRFRFSLATEASTYSALRIVRGLLPAPEWSLFAEKSDSLSRLADDLCEAILVLAKQGITDDGLARELAVACGDGRRSRPKMKKMASLPGISSNVKNWLVSGRDQHVAEQERGETRQLSDDARLADLFVDSQRFQAQTGVIEEQILPELAVLDPRLSAPVSRFLQGGVVLCDAIQSMARRKNLRIRGQAGDEEDYSPADHELVGEGGGAARRVRIIRPVVEQIREEGVAFVISKGLVEKVE